MKNKNTIYNIVVHIVNLFLLGFLGFIAFFSIVNISPTPTPYGLLFGYDLIMLLIWGVNYWYQYNKRKWTVLIAGTILYVVIALVLLGLVVPTLAKIIDSYENARQVEDMIGEDYDGGVPFAQLYMGNEHFSLAKGNTSWSTTSGSSEQTIKDIEEYASSMNAINVSSGRKVFLGFTKNKENGERGGDIWMDSKITVSLLKGDERIELELDESNEFYFPKNTGNYVLEVEFESPAGKAQYVGNVTIY